jgi:uncharacterized repeat protein (TIGR01451 family)/LPXTG-motif cell wall-anchored protein
MRQIRRIFSAILVLLGVVIVVPAFAGLASAHHSNIAGSAVCDGTVSWTATSWSTGLEGTNTDILVTKTINGTKTDIIHGAFNAANNYQFSGTFSWPGNTSNITISSLPIATWANNVVSPVGSSVVVNKPTGCPGVPAVTPSVSCVNTSPGSGDGQVVLTLSNAAGQFGGSPVTFTVFNPDQLVTSKDYTLSVGGSTPVTFGPLADGSHTVKILVGQKDYSQTFIIECDSPLPAVTLTQTCANGDGSVTVTLKNTGGESVVFDITNPTTLVVEHVTVPAKGSVPKTYSGFADGDYKITIKVGTTDFSQSFTIDCDHPKPVVTSTVACANNDGAITITLSNVQGTEAVTFYVTHADGTIQAVPVGIGGSTSVTLGGYNDGPHTVKVTADNQDFTQTFNKTCDAPPTFSHTETCDNADGSVTVSMTNNGDDVNAIFVLAGISHTLAPGETLPITLTGYADGNQPISLTVNGVDKSFTILVNCDRPGTPAVHVSQDCANQDGIVVVTLQNVGGQLPLTFTVQGTNYVVAANTSVDVPLSGLLDGTQTIVITQGDNVFSQPVTIGCDLPPTAAFTQTCVNGDNGVSNGQVVVTLNNNGDDVDVVFTVNGVPTTVGPKLSATVTLSGLADGPNTVNVLAGTVKLGFDVITVACDHPGVGTISVVPTCVNNDGQVTVTLIATGGELPVVFMVNDIAHSVAPNTTQDVVIGGLNDGSNHIKVLVGDKDLSFDTTTSCDLPPLVSFSEACANFDDVVSVVITNQGDDVAVTFTIDGTDYVLAPGVSQTVPVGPLADGTNTITVAVNGVARPSIVVQSHCNPPFTVTAVCNSVDVSGAVTGHWFTLTNSGSADVDVTWNGGSATIPAGQSTTVSSMASPFVLLNNGEQIAQASANETTCVRTVTFTKDLKGAPATSETYTIQVSRLVDGSYVPETTFTINAGETKTINLPSTLDPAGINYKIDEINPGSANTSTISPNQLTLAGHLGETVSVIVTNGYASVQIDKTTSTSTVVPGGQITYSMQVTNTGGLTLNPVVVSDRLPANTELATASIAGGAGQCVLTQTTRPQLLTCTMSDPLAPGAVTNLITLVVNVDSTVAAGTTIVNQAMVHGAYSDGAVMSGIATEGGELTCIPAVAGTVCDLSAQVGVPVSEVLQASSPPVPTAAADAVVVQLPRTGAEHLREMLALGFGAILLGGAMLLGRRRLGAR